MIPQSLLVHFPGDVAQRQVQQLKTASSLGNEPRSFVSFRSDMFSDSFALVV